MKKFKVLSLVTLIVFFSSISGQAFGLSTLPKTTSTVVQQSVVYEPGTKVTTDGLYKYSVNTLTKSATITQYLGSAENVVIPLQVSGYTVERIGNNAFYGNTTLKSVTIPQIKSIGDNVFYGCTKLQTVSISEMIQTIGANVFVNCPINKITVSRFGIYSSEQISLTTLSNWTSIVSKMSGVNISNVTGKYYSYNDKYIKNLLTNFTYTTVNNEITIVRYNGTAVNLVVPDIIDGKLVTQLGPDAFASDRYLQSVVLPENISTVGKECFYSCSSLENLTLSIETTEVGEDAFLNTQVESLTIDYGLLPIEEITSEDAEMIIETQYGIDYWELVLITITNDSGDTIYISPPITN